MNARSPFLTVEQERVASVDSLVLSHEPLVQKMARQFARYGLDVEDLIQEGNVALIKAAEKFDPNNGARFSTYAMWYVRCWMRELVMNDHSVVRPSRSRGAKLTFFKSRPHHDVSMETPIGEGDGFTIADTLASSDPRPDELAEASIDAGTISAAIHRAIETLNLREADIIRSRFLAEQKQSLEVIGARYGISKERVRQLEHSALTKLKKELVNL